MKPSLARLLSTLSSRSQISCCWRYSAAFPNWDGVFISQSHVIQVRSPHHPPHTMKDQLETNRQSMKRSKRLYLGSYVFRPDLQMPRPNVRAFIALQHKNDIINWNEKKKSREWKWLFCLLITSWRESVPASSSLTKESKPLIFFLPPKKLFYCKPLIFFLPPKNFSIKNSARLLLYTLMFHWLPCLPTHRQHRLQNPKHECLVSAESSYWR